jgi:competence ComEA-like helix-hairpin-helix protein
MSNQLDTSLTNSEALAPWKRGQVPAHWPDFAADRVDDGPRTALDNALLRERVREAPPMHELLVTMPRAGGSELAAEPRLALDAYRHEHPNELVLDELADDDELDGLSADDELVLGDSDIVGLDELSDGRVRGALMKEPADVTRDHAPALLERTRSVFKRTAANVLVPIGAIAILVLAMGGTWSTAGATPAPQWSATTPPSAPRTTTPARTAIEIDEPDHPGHAKSGRKDLAGKLNLNTANEDQLMLLPTVGPSKAERIVTWRKKNGGFKRTADLRRVKGFGYKTFKKLEPFLDIKGDTTLAAK